MIRPRPQHCTIANATFMTAYQAITKSGAAQSIENHYHHARKPGGRKISGIDYTATAVLTALLVRFLMSRPYSLRGAMDTIGEFTADQLAIVGMDGQDCTAITTSAKTEYHRLWRFWQARMEPLDPDFDLRSKRMTNGQFTRLLAARTPAERQQSRAADERLTTLINDLLYGSIWNDNPAGCDGDVVVDETIINTADPRGTLGVRDDKYRSASSIAGYWARDKQRYVIDLGTYAEVRTNGFGIGATFLSRVGSRDALHCEPALFIGMDVHRPTSGSIAGLTMALTHARRTGLDSRKGGRSSWPLLTSDMGYNNKNGFGALMLQMQYSPVVRYPQNWDLEHPCANPPGGPEGPPPGPVQYAGAFFCPAVMDRIKDHRTPSTEELLNNDGYRAHDRRLRQIYPFLMGYHSRPAMADIQNGRPRLGAAPPQQRAKIRLVCPAALGTVKCPLRPESMNTDVLGLPEAKPDWPAEAKACCHNSSISVYLTDRQLQLAQWDLVPGSTEHTLYYEAARALTEQRFSQLKSRHVAGLQDLTTGPRRTPMTKIAVALAAAAVNIIAQQNHDPTKVREESIDIRLRQLAKDLGQPPARMPRRS